MKVASWFRGERGSAAPVVDWGTSRATKVQGQKGGSPPHGAHTRTHGHTCPSTPKPMSEKWKERV